ncbi:inactive metallocarboxypeptidase Ecm14p [Monosporozyma unispora]|nr:putative metallocarboxypeptidase ecm14 [Kazachstania unispora]
MVTLRSCVLLLSVIGSQIQGHSIPHNKELIHSDYSKDGVIRCFHDNSQTISTDHIIKKLSHCGHHRVEIWNNNDQFIDIQMSIKKFNKIDKISKKLGMNCNVMIENLNTVIQDTLPQNKRDNEILMQMLMDYPIRTDDEMFNMETNRGIHTKLTEYFFQEYRDLQSLQIWFNVLQQWFPNILTLKSIGKTSQGNDLNVLEINVNNVEKNPKGKTIVITGGTHSREWISISTVCYIMFSLLNDYDMGINGEDNILNSLNFIFAPTLNPDGYEYTWVEDRLWRKNRQDTGNLDCPGFDLDRTFGYHWQATNEFPCSGNYNGDMPFAAMESSLWDTYIQENFKRHHDHRLYGFIDFHSYSQEILYPFTYSCDELPNDIENLLELAFDLSKTIRKFSGKQYDVVQSCKDRDADINPTGGSGSMLDYMYDKGAHWSYQIKLRDTGNHGFLLPPSYIHPVGREGTRIVQAMCDFLLNPPNWN